VGPFGRVALLDVHDPHTSITSNLCRESGGVEMMGREPTTPCLQSQIGDDRDLGSQGMVQVEPALALSVVIRSGPVMTVVNGTLVARPARGLGTEWCRRLPA
jgi:hypothetical protein